MLFLQELAIFPPLADTELAELKACRRAVELAIEMGVRKLVLESDSQAAVQKNTDRARNLSAYGHLVHEIKTLPNSCEERVAWVRRCANNAAHILAREGCLNSLCKTWFRVPPECVNLVVASECVGI